MSSRRHRDHHHHGRGGSRNNSDAGTSELREEIRNLTQELLASNTTRITKRRETGKRLLELLSKERNRTRLVNEMYDMAIKNGYSRASARKRSYELVWGPVIKSAFMSAKILVNSGGGGSSRKSKLNPDDVKLPLKLLHFSDMSSSSPSGGGGGGGKTTTTTIEDGRRVKIEPTSKIGSKAIHHILDFCFDMLNDDDVREVAELDLLNTLVYVCERVDHVAHLKPEVEIIKILEIVEDSLESTWDEETNKNITPIEAARIADVAAIASRIFASMIESCVELGMGLFVIANRCIRLVSKWCKEHVEKASDSGNSRLISSLFRAVTAILRFHPDQSIKPLMRSGGHLLKFAKRAYLKSTTENKHAIHGYLIAHIIVNQKAGEIKGLLPGEMGNLGEATLDARQLGLILPEVLSSLTKVELSITVKKRVSWKTLDATIRTHLECCARLLACAQRQFLMDEEWKLLEKKDPNQFFTRLVKEFSRDKEDLVLGGIDPTSCSDYPCCPPSTLAASPWAEHILKPLLFLLPEMTKNNVVTPYHGFGSVPSTVDSFSQNSTQDSPVGPDSNSPSLIHPLLDEIQQESNSRMKVEAVDINNKAAVLLLVISACAEAFPSGRCWRSTSHKHWYTLRPDDDNNDDDHDRQKIVQMRGDLVHVNLCSPGDLSPIVHVVAKVLEAAGRSNTGDPELQILALLCLLRLTEAHSALVSFLVGNEKKEMEDLAASWRQVWAILFRSDLRYAGSTAHATEGSCGQLVLILLTEIMHGWCTDPAMTFSKSVSQKQSTFLYRKQFQIWALPAFSRGTSSLRTIQTLEVACAFLHSACLSEEGRDNMPDEAPSIREGGDSVNDEGQKGVGRRHRLVCLCLHALNSLKPTSGGRSDQRLASLATACLTALVNGKISLSSRTFLDESQNLTWVRSSKMGLKNKLCFTEMTGTAVSFSTDSDQREPRKSLYHTLWWKSPILDPGASSLQQIRWDESRRIDCTLAEKLTICARIRSIETSSDHVDYVPTAISVSLHDLLQLQIKNILTRWTSVDVDEPSDQKDDDDLQESSVEAALSVSSLWLKVAISTQVLVDDDDKISSGLESVLEHALSIFQKVNTSLPSLCQSRDEFHVVFLDLLQILRFLTELSSRFSVEIPKILRDGISPFIGTCDSLLLSFAGEHQSDAWDNDDEDDNQSSSSSESEKFQTKTTVDLLDDSDDDSIVNRRKHVPKKKKKAKKSKKRKKSKPSKRADGSPRRKKKRQHPSPPDSSCACIVASVLVTLEPSVSRCESVVDCLLKKGGRDSEVDLTEAYHCLNLLSDASVIFHEQAVSQLGEQTSAANPMDESFRHQSPISLICSVLKKLRDSAPGGSSLHMFGFQLCAESVRLGESDLRGMKLTMDESKQIAEQLLLDNDPSVQSRPYLRSIQLRAATEAYLLGGNNVTDAMDKFKNLLITSLKDLCPHVRDDVCHGVGVAVHKFSKPDVIVRSVSKRLPPVALPSDENESRTYSEWYQNFDLGTGELEAENIVWNDALKSMESSAITCRAVLAGGHADSTRDIVCDLLEIATERTKLQAKCLQACDRIALVLGYENAEGLLDEMSVNILGKWLERGESLAHIPLLLTSPSLLRLLLRTGQEQKLHRDKPAASDEEETKIWDVRNLVDVATDEFVERHKAYIVPQMLLRICDSEQTEDLDAMSLVARDANFRELCATLKNGDDKVAIKAVVQSGFHDIEAFVLPMDHSEKLSPLRGKMMKLVDDILKESEAETEKKRGGKPHLTIRRILELSGTESRDIYPSPIVQEAFSEAISGFVDKLKATKNGDILSAAGTSLTECFLYARKWLESATLDGQKELRWNSVSLLFGLILKQIHRKEFKQTQVSFGVKVLVDILLNPKLSCIHSKTLTVLDEVLEEVVSSIGADSDALKAAFSVATKRLVGSLMKIHEENQQKLISLSRSRAKTRLQILQRSVGLLGIQVAGDTWGWDSNVVAGTRRSISLETSLKEFKSDHRNRFVEGTITGTFDLLMRIFDNATVLDLGQDCFVGSMPPFSASRIEQEALAATNKRFCAQTVAVDFGKRNQVNQTEDLSRSIDSLLEELKNRSAWMDSLSGALPMSRRFHNNINVDENAPSLTMSQWMIRAALVQLEHKLRDARMSKDTRLSNGDTWRLVQELSFVCGSSCPETLRTAASRCLGELDPNLLYKEPATQSPLSVVEYYIQQGLENDDLLRGIQAHAIEVLGDEYLYAQRSRVAIAAVDTLIALCRDGSNCWDLLGEKAQQHLLPVLSGKRRPINLNKMSLSKTRLASIKSKAGLENTDSETSEWCWNEDLWHCPPGPESTFESWICDLVPALIYCCYWGATNPKSSSAFFGVCQNMASISPRFATAIFPALILDLLQKNANSMDDSPQTALSFKLVAQDTWIGPADSSINQQLSSSFQILLSTSNQNPRAIALALDTLEMLRRATQSRFLKSESHKRNSNAMPSMSSSKTSSKKRQKTSRSSRSPKSTSDTVVTRDSQYNVGLGEAVPWQGLPFGTVLKLKGELVVQACICARRFTSALFYSDLYLEARFAGSGAVMQELADDFTEASDRALKLSKSDISGYFLDAQACEPSTLRERAIASLKQLGECYMQLSEVDAYQAAERQSSDLRYSDNTLAIGSREEQKALLVPSLGELQRLDAMSNTPQYSVSTSIQTAEAIGSLGLRSLLQSYIGSMDLQNVSSMPVKERRQLREKWFESRLYGMNWDEALISDGPEVGHLATSSICRKPVLGETELSREEIGFHEAITTALSAFAHDDLSCQALLNISRASILKPLSSIASDESTGNDFCTLVEKLQVLNDIENLVQGSESADTLLERWGFCNKADWAQSPTKAVAASTYVSAGISPHAREAVIRSLRFKSAQQSTTQVFDPQQCLIQHLRSFGSWCRQMKFLPAAESSMQRLSSVGASFSSLELVLGQRLEEAHLREAKGDVATAIRMSKQVIGILKEERQRRNNRDPAIDCVLADALISCGGWLSKNKIEPAHIILDSYHTRGSELAKNLYRQNNTKENAQRYLKSKIALAHLASGLYDSISTRVKGPAWTKAGIALNERQEELRHCENMVLETREKFKKTTNKKQQAQVLQEQGELYTYGRQLKGEIKLALEERGKTETALEKHLQLAVESYTTALSIAGVGQEIDMSRHVFRMVFLWLSNCSDVGEGGGRSKLNELVDQSIERIPSFRFVALTSQLFAQIDSKSNCGFQTTLHKLVEKMCQEHPYHCLVQLISMCNGREVGEGVSGRNVDFFLENMSESKVHAAKEMCVKLKRKDASFVGELLDNYNILMGAYIKLANAPTAKFVENNQTKRISLSQVSKNHQSLDRILSRRQDCLPCILTSPPPLRSGCDYGGGREDPIGGERVRGFENHFAITDSGLHRPKIVVCEGTKGGRFRQLVKGEDEIRQDAVMEQVFGYVNGLMRRKNVDNTVADGPGGSSANNLRMVTYNIIPLSPASGVLEWVENSTTLGDYILDAKTSRGYRLGSHSRYYPGEWGNNRCRHHYAQSPLEEKRETFEIVCNSFSPSFRFFFVERFGHDLKAWYTAKMKYTRSVAVSSIVGHILGIGDRHTNNILVSQITGEVVHIDFGIVFEQGKLLPAPELVPFRLTRNIVDGFGPIGTEGPFTRSAEATALVLRENANALLTILSAIASDPLYRWSVSPVEARRRQRLTDDNDNQPTPNGNGSNNNNNKEKRRNGSGGGRRSSSSVGTGGESKSERNEAAALVLTKCQEKLQGYEDGTSGEQQGIEGQVQLLINSARDPAKLSVMFPGWAPWI